MLNWFPACFICGRLREYYKCVSSGALALVYRRPMAIWLLAPATIKLISQVIHSTFPGDCQIEIQIEILHSSCAGGTQDLYFHSSCAGMQDLYFQNAGSLFSFLECRISIFIRRALAAARMLSVCASGALALLCRSLIDDMIVSPIGNWRDVFIIHMSWFRVLPTAKNF